MAHAKSRYFSEQFDAIARELSVLAIACDIDFFGGDDVAEKILKNDASVCGRHNPAAFEKVRHHILALYPLEEKAIERIGADQTKEIIDEVRAAIKRLRDEGKPGSA